MKTNYDLYEDALKAINDLYSDTSVSQQECRSNLEALISEIELLLDTLKDDDLSDKSIPF